MSRFRSYSLGQQIFLGCLLGLAGILALEAQSVLHLGASGVIVRDSGNRTVVEARRGKSHLVAQFHGDVELAVDGSGIANLGQGAKVKIRTKRRGDRHRLIVTRSDQGNLSYNLRVNGKKSQMDAEAQEWLAAVCVQIFRLTGFRADERIDHLLASGDVGTVLREIDEIRSDSIQRIYLELLADKAELTEFELSSVLDLVAEHIGSDTESGLALQALVSPTDLDSQRVRSSFLKVTERIGSDSVLRLALERILGQPGVSQPTRQTVLKGVGTIGSDSELAKVLLAVIETLQHDEDIPEGFDRALATIGSDFEQRRVLQPAVKHPGLSPSMLAALLRTATSIGSDYELAELLSGLAAARNPDEHLPLEFFAAAKTIGSDGEQRRVLTAVLDRRQLSSQEVLGVLDNAASIGSDFEAAELLVHVARRGLLSDAVRPEFEAVLERVGSRFENERVREELAQARPAPSQAPEVQSGANLSTSEQAAAPPTDRVAIEQDGLEPEARTETSNDSELVPQ